MARISLARQQMSDHGLAAAYSPAVEVGHAVENNGKIVLHVRNSSEASVTVTLRTGYTRSGLKLADRAVELAPGQAVFLGPLDPTTYNQPPNGGGGRVYIDYSAVEDVTVAALLVP